MPRRPSVMPVQRLAREFSTIAPCRGDHGAKTKFLDLNRAVVMVEDQSPSISNVAYRRGDAQAVGRSMCVPFGEIS